jgi:hypothetical protein
MAFQVEYLHKFEFIFEYDLGRNLKTSWALLMKNTRNKKSHATIYTFQKGGKVLRARE